jgi:hypothetical protein
MPRMILTLSQITQKYYLPKTNILKNILTKCPSQNMLWLLFKLCGLQSYTSPKQIDF